MYRTDIVITDIDTVSHNFLMGNNIFINDEITYANCSYLIADFYFNIVSNNIFNTIELFINSPGGELDTALSIINCIKVAKKHGITVNTHVTGEAGSAASLIATFGDNRYMNEYAQHFVHFGSYYGKINKETEIKKFNKEAKKFHDICQSIYLTNTNIPEDVLDNLMEDEYGYLTAKECLKYKFCTEII